MNGWITILCFIGNFIGAISYFWSEQTPKDDMFFVLSIVVVFFLGYQLKTYDRKNLL